MTTDLITENAKAILLLCGHFGAADDRQLHPLSIREYNEMAEWLMRKTWEPAHLLDGNNLSALDEALVPVDPKRLKSLLARGAAMAIAVEKWLNKGLWVVCRSDPGYPRRLKQHLKRNAPPILYGVGNQRLLSAGGLAVVGSRRIDNAMELFAREAGRAAARSGMQLVSGAARGVDETAMLGALEQGGSVVGVMADSLLRAALSGKYRQGIRNGQLLLVSPYHPESRFNVGNAMGRNKHIYALADVALVVNADFQKGGTWAGAEEELRREGGRPVFVRATPPVSKGNAGLMNMGGRPLPDSALHENLLDYLRQNEGVPQAAQTPTTEAPAEFTQTAPRQTPTAYKPEILPLAPSPAVGESAVPAPAAILETVRPLILDALQTPQKIDDLAKSLNVRKPQMQDWIRTLMESGFVEEKAIKRSKKIALRNAGEELPLSPPPPRS